MLKYGTVCSLIRKGAFLGAEESVMEREGSSYYKNFGPGTRN